MLGDNFTSARVALNNCDREMVNKLKIFHRKNLFPSICKLKVRGDSTFEGLLPFSDLHVPAAAKCLSPCR